MAIYDIRGNLIAPSGVADTSRVVTSHVISEPNLANPNDFEVGWINTTTGGEETLSTANTGTRTTGRIPCSAGQIVSMGYITGYNHNPWFVATAYKEWCLAYAFFSADGIVISGGNSRPTVTGGVETPEGAVYVRITFYVDQSADPVTNPEKFYVHVSGHNITEPKYFFADNIEKIYVDPNKIGYAHNPFPLLGKTWTLFGDSLTDSYGGHGWDMETSPVGGDGWKDSADNVPWTGYFWASRIARETGLTLDNRAASGSNIYISRVYTDVSGVYKLQEYIAELEAGTIEQSEIITVGFGANSVADEFGTDADDSSITDSLYGGTKYFIETIRAKSPMSRLVFILQPPQSGWRDTEGNARAVIKSICDAYAVEYVDMTENSGITVDMLPDSLHVSSKEANNAYYNRLKGIFGL